MSKEEIKKIQEDLINIKEELKIFRNDELKVKDVIQLCRSNDLSVDSLLELSFVIINKQNFLISKYNKLNDQLKEIQKGCDHDMVNIGHDSHHEYYRCSICGYQERF